MKKYTYHFTVPEVKGVVDIEITDVSLPDSHYDELAQEKALTDIAAFTLASENVVLDECYVIENEGQPLKRQDVGEQWSRNDDKLEDALNQSHYVIKNRAVFNREGLVVSSVYELFDYENPNDDGSPGMMFTSYLSALHFWAQELRLEDAVDQCEYCIHDGVCHNAFDDGVILDENSPKYVGDADGKCRNFEEK